MAQETIVPTPQAREADIKAKQTRERRAAKGTVVETATTRAKQARTNTVRAIRMPAPTPKKQTVAKSKASRVRDLLDHGKTVRECADALKEFGVTWAYAWDVAAAYEKKTGKVFIPSHAPAKASKESK